jgi:NADH-quinone oxidoreductase subunit C
MSRLALDKLKAKFPDGVLHTDDFRGDETAVITRSDIVDICRWLRDHDELKFDMLTDMTAVDYLPRHPRFEVVYHLYSVPNRHRLRLKVQLSEQETELDSVCQLWPIANWLEREIWDMYGISFRGHPDLRRILLYDEFSGHPLRKDYPKEKRQPRVRRPENEIAEALSRRTNTRSPLAEKR